MIKYTKSEFRQNMTTALRIAINETAYHINRSFGSSLGYVELLWANLELA